MKNKEIEEIYDNMHEKISNDINKNEELQKLCSQLQKLEDELFKTLAKPESEIFDDYVTKESEVIDCERKKAFSYGYNLANKLLIDSLRD